MNGELRGFMPVDLAPRYDPPDAPGVKMPRVTLPLSRSLFVFILLVAAACGASPGEIEEAELGLAETRAEIERLAGYSSAETPALAIPSVPRVRLTREEHVLVDALLTSAPETWSQEERPCALECSARFIWRRPVATPLSMSWSGWTRSSAPGNARWPTRPRPWRATGCRWSLPRWMPRV